MNLLNTSHGHGISKFDVEIYYFFILSSFDVIYSKSEENESIFYS